MMDRIDTLIRELEGASGSAERGAILDALTYAHASKWIDTAAFHRAQKMLHVGAFLSAAMVLVPEGWNVNIEIASFQNAAWLHKTGETVKSDYGTNRPPALALSIASLKARRGA